MKERSSDELLNRVEQPSRYLGNEVNSVRKDSAAVALRLALAFPDLYEIGTSHFGLQILYSLLNQEAGIAAERVFAPAPDMEARLRATHQRLCSLESARPLADFDIVGFSLLYELNFTNILTILDLAGIPFRSQERSLKHPLIIAGGPCTVNPEPLADLFDAMVIGDGEDVLLEMAHVWLAWKGAGGVDKTELLLAWSKLEGVYIPAFFTPRFDSDGFQTVLPVYPKYTSVRRRIVSNLDTAPFPQKPIVPYGRPVHDRLRLEVSRGCTRGCRFCQAGMIYRPVRERSVERLLDLTDAALAATGYEDLSLLSLSTGDYGCIEGLMEALMANYADQRVAVSLPSLRAGTLSPTLMQLIKTVRKTGFTIAPEAGSQRLRNVINKNITEDEIVKTVQNAFSLGWRIIKLYFMIGLPTESQEDLEAIVALVQRLRQIKGEGGRRGNINVSVATFIPKPHTPFQWCGQNTLAEATAKIEWLKAKLDLPGVRVKWQQPEVSQLEGLWARGDRRLGRLLLHAYRLGCRFDGWSDQFRYDLWTQALADEGFDLAFYVTRTRRTEEPLPWDHIDVRVTRAFLNEEWQAAMAETTADDCRRGDCLGCGVCDFDTIAPRVFEPATNRLSDPQTVMARAGTDYLKLRVGFSKRGPARHFGHLEMINIFKRAIRRARIPVKYSQGFHPLPKMAFQDTLPVGMESMAEALFVQVPAAYDFARMADDLNAHLPAGLRVSGVRPAPGKQRSLQQGDVDYWVLRDPEIFDPRCLAAFASQEMLLLPRTDKKGRVRNIDLKKAVREIGLVDAHRLRMTIRPESGKIIRPQEVLAAVFDYSGEQIRDLRIIKEACDTAERAV